MLAEDKKSFEVRVFELKDPIWEIERKIQTLAPSAKRRELLHRYILSRRYVRTNAESAVVMEHDPDVQKLLKEGKIKRMRLNCRVWYRRWTFLTCPDFKQNQL